MVGSVVEREVGQSISPTSAASSPTNQPPSGSSGGVLRSSIYKQESNGSFPNEQDLLDEKKLQVAVALAMLVGLLQVGTLCTLFLEIIHGKYTCSPVTCEQRKASCPYMPAILSMD